MTDKEKRDDEQVSPTVEELRAGPQEPATLLPVEVPEAVVQPVDPRQNQSVGFSTESLTIEMAIDFDRVKAQGKPRSSRWPMVRSNHLKNFPTCAACGCEDSLEVHHIEPFHLCPERELDPTNLLTLCEKSGRWCHFREGHGYDWSNYNDRVEQDAKETLKKLKRMRERR